MGDLQVEEEKQQLTTDNAAEANDKQLLSAARCRICHQESPTNQLIIPCDCSGDQLYVHRRCLDDWRALNLDGHSFLHCTVCKAAYSFEPITDTIYEAQSRLDSWQSRTSLFVSLIAIIGLSSLLFLAIFINAADLNNNIPAAFGPSVSPLMAYLIMAIICIFIILSIWGIVCYLYGLHLPMAARLNWYQGDVYDYAETSENRADHCFCFHPDYYCYSCYGLQYEYALLNDHQPYYIEYLIIAAMILATLLAGIVVGAAFAIYLLYRTGGRYIEKLRLEELTRKYRVADRRSTRKEYIDKQINITTEDINDEIVIPIKEFEQQQELQPSSSSSLSSSYAIRGEEEEKRRDSGEKKEMPSFPIIIPIVDRDRAISNSTSTLVRTSDRTVIGISDADSQGSSEELSPRDFESLIWSEVKDDDDDDEEETEELSEWIGHTDDNDNDHEKPSDVGVETDSLHSWLAAQ